MEPMVAGGLNANIVEGNPLGGTRLCKTKCNVSINCIDAPAVHSARGETGLDDSPLCDSAEFIDDENVIDQWGVGMSAFCAKDCLDIAALSDAVGQNGGLPEHLRNLANLTSTGVQKHLWNPDVGIHVNKKWTDGKWVDKDKQTGVHPLAPTSFYPMLAGVPSDEQVTSMLRGFLGNVSEFGVNAEHRHGIPSISRSSSSCKDNDCWRGRIWAPMNHLVHAGLQECCHLSSVRRYVQLLANQSRETFLVEWVGHCRTMENFNSESGMGCDVQSAQPFCHWGALLALISELQAEEKVQGSADALEARR